MGQTVAVLGGGKIGEALLGGLVAAGHAPGSLLVVEPAAARAVEVGDRHGVGVVDAPEAARRADVLVVAVKPAQVPTALDQVHEAVAGREDRPIVVSLAAGIPTATLEAHLPAGTAVVRVMPNTPMLVGRAMCVLSAGSAAGEAELATTETLLAAVGRTVRVPEAQQDVATALSGSGPAYVFLLAEAMIDAGVALGLPRPVATELVTTTVDGAGGLLTTPGSDGREDEPPHAGLLREAVTSPGGTTAAALGVLEADGLRAALARAVTAARDRSVALGRGDA
ncbi:pyrroline-5-carboxylate reductase [Actinomycetospora sp. NBRC 106375]|uniref:pyrroline-5-carboxylate reductase n=1 Tax=Actinomycetospora sp. NBRC 106375 TaxID=3032207 RepID=UPI0024A1C93C|nr:pyrroline-5-carboxylate reductase [Actinomycetospora sp. NBRC 106375]GLZ44804.1 pyrroline-5-carboxylate reductase [Actinomycetospora sp. NBRC 106375]